MSACIYCKQKFTGFWGFLRTRHKECDKKYQDGKFEIRGTIANILADKRDACTIKAKVTEIASSSFIPADIVTTCLVDGWELAVNKALEDKILTHEEEQRLMEIAEVFSLTQKDLDGFSAWTRTAMSAALRDVMEGKIPQQQNINGTLPFNYQKEEKQVWVFTNVPYYEEKVSRSFQGGYAGVSIRVAKGLYYRTGGFKGAPVENASMVHICNGNLAITNKHLYFSGGTKSFRLPYPKLVSIEPYSDGIRVTKDTASGKPLVFLTGNGWFIYNLVKHLAAAG